MKHPLHLDFFIIFLFLLPSITYAEESAKTLTGSTFIAVVRVSDPINNYGKYLIINDLKESVENKIKETENYFLSRAPPEVKLSFTHKFFDASLNYTPDYSSTKDIWIDDALNVLGYYDSNKDGTSIDEFADALRRTYPADNIIIVFVPAVGYQGNLFGGRLGYAYPTGDNREYTVIYAYEIYGIAAMGSQVYTHEILHLFGTQDEYSKIVSSYGCEGGEVSYWAKSPMNTYYPNYNCQYLNLCVGKSVMQAGDFLSTIGDWFNISTPMDFWAQGMVGWKDFDMNGILDYKDNLSLDFKNHAPVKMSGVFKDENVHMGVATRIISFRNSKVTSYTVWQSGTNGLLYDGDHSAIISFISPDGNIISSTPITVPSKSCKDIQAAVPLSLDNMEKSKLPGAWKVRADYDKQIIFFDGFRITAPVIDVFPQSKDIGIIYKGQKYTSEFEVRNIGDDYGIITSTNIQDFPEGSSLVQLPDSRIDSNKSSKGGVVVGSQQLGKFLGTITIASDDPKNPIKTIALSGTVKEFIKLILSVKDSHIEVDRPVEFEITSEKGIENNARVLFGTKIIDTKDSNKATIIFDKPGKHTLFAAKDNTSTTDYQKGGLTIEVFKKPVKQQLSINIQKTQYATGEPVNIQVFADGIPIQATVKYDGAAQQTDSDGKLSLLFNEPKNVTITTYRDILETEREIISFDEASTTIDIVKPSSPIEGFIVWLKSVLNFLSGILSRNS